MQPAAPRPPEGDPAAPAVSLLLLGAPAFALAFAITTVSALVPLALEQPSSRVPR